MPFFLLESTCSCCVAFKTNLNIQRCKKTIRSGVKGAWTILRLQIYPNLWTTDGAPTGYSWATMHGWRWSWFPSWWVANCAAWCTGLGTCAKCSGWLKPLLIDDYMGLCYPICWGLPRFILGNPLTSHYKGTRQHIGLGHTAQRWRFDRGSWGIHWQKHMGICWNTMATWGMHIQLPEKKWY